jgi:hypothetical protein
MKTNIYVAASNMCFNINGRKTRFSFIPLNLRRTLANLTTLDDIDSIEIVKTKFYKDPVIKGWHDISWPVKKGDPGRPIIGVSIGPNTLEAICDLGAAINIIPMSIYDNVLQLA